MRATRYITTLLLIGTLGAGTALAGEADVAQQQAPVKESVQLDKSNTSTDSDIKDCPMRGHTSAQGARWAAAHKDCKVKNGEDCPCPYDKLHSAQRADMSKVDEHCDLHAHGKMLRHEKCDPAKEAAAEAK